MSKCDCTTVYVQFTEVKSKFSSYCYRLCCKCFISFDKIKVINTHACLSKNFLCRCNRSDTHDLRIHTAKSTCYESSHRFNTKFFCFFFAHNNDSCCTIIDSGSITGSNKTVFVDWTKSCKSFHCRSRTWSLIFIKDNCLFFLLNFNRYDLIIKFTGFLSSYSFCLTCNSKLIQFFTCQVPSWILTDVICCLDHMIIIECIPKSIVYHRIDNGIVVHTISETSLFQSVWSHGHVFHTTCYYDICISCLNHLCCHIYTVQTGTTNNVYGYCRCLDWKSCINRSLTCNVLSKTCLDYTTHVNMIHLICRYSCSLQSFFDHDRTKYWCGCCTKASTHCTDGSTTCAC